MKNAKFKILFLGLVVFLTCSYGYSKVKASSLIRIEQQAKSITGYVFDENGEPVIGATVKAAGSTKGTVTDLDGKFSLDVPVGTNLFISYIGYKPQTIKAQSTSVKVHLVVDDKTLNEVIVVGYGTVKRKNFTGSVSTVDVANSPISLTPKTNAMDNLRGTTSGISVSQQQGAGQSPSMQVRGQKSISGSSSPLIVLDGVIYMGNYNDIDPNIIESMSVLKDATSLAAYGSQAANGVIMITTKKGSSDKCVGVH